MDYDIMERHSIMTWVVCLEMGFYRYADDYQAKKL